MAPHNEALTKQLKRVISSLQMAVEDAEEDFQAAIAHAEIADVLLRSTILMAKSAKVA